MSPKDKNDQDKSFEDGEDTESDKDPGHEIAFETEVLPDTPPSEAAPYSDRVEETPYQEAAELVHPYIGSHAPGSPDFEQMRLSLGDTRFPKNFVKIFFNRKDISRIEKEFAS